MINLTDEPAVQAPGSRRMTQIGQSDISPASGGRHSPLLQESSSPTLAGPSVIDLYKNNALLPTKLPNFQPNEDLHVVKCVSIVTRQGPENPEIFPMVEAIYNPRVTVKRTADALKTRWGTISRNAQKYNRARTSIDENIPSGQSYTEAEIREGTMKLFQATNKYKKKGVLVPAPKIKYVEACLYLRNEPKYCGVQPSQSRSPVSGPAADVVPPAGYTAPLPPSCFYSYSRLFCERFGIAQSQRRGLCSPGWREEDKENESD